MSDTISYTPDEVAGILKISRFTVYEMIKRGDLKAYRIGRKVRVEDSDLDDYIQKSKNGKPDRKVAGQAAQSTDKQEILVICGQDAILDILTRHLAAKMPQVNFLRHYIGSINGLLALYHGVAHIVTAHLWDSDTDTYNIPFIRRLLPGHPTALINLAYRMEGFYVAKGNPKEITDFNGLAKEGVRFVNREKGSGARVLVDEKLRQYKINHSSVLGYEDEATTHLAVASKVARGGADVGVGVEKAALQVENIDFIPIKKERYDIIVRQEDLSKPPFQAMLAVLRSSEFKNEVGGLGGYDLSETGNILARI